MTEIDIAEHVKAQWKPGSFWKVIVSFCVEAMRKHLPGILKYSSTTITGCFLHLAESFHVMGLLSCKDTLCKADVVTEDFFL